MIIVKESGHLTFKNLKFRCALGKAGIGKKIREGDSITPRGIFKLVKVFYRADKIKNLKTPLKKIRIKKNMGWCDDPKSKFYNKLIILPINFGCEKLYRSDRLYDLVVVLNYNLNPIIKNKGSAIFIHVAKKTFKKTEGCIALNKENLINLLSVIKKNTKIKII
jgi:L,D-peptidoglycan transpeptidase YkuD (ErfK/YbiS/YcfS/YnhG family)